MLSQCGSIESSDCLIRLYDGKGIEIHIESIVIKQYGAQIRKVIFDVLGYYNLNDIKVEINDVGALDYTIKARLMCALRRAELI